MQLMGLGGDTNAADYGQYARSFGTDSFEQDPGYAFRQAEGLKGLERSASARGGTLSGGALKGIQRFSQDLASQEYSNAFNRYQTERAARLGVLGNLSASGQGASNIMTGAAGQLGTNSAANALARAQATSANSIGRGNAASANALGRAGATGTLAVNRGAATGNIATNRAATTGNLLLDRGEATAATALNRAGTTSANLLNRNAANTANTSAYYDRQGNLVQNQGQYTAQNAYNVAQAAQQGAMNMANAGSAAAYNVGNAQATGAMNAGAARAAGQVGQANAYSNALGQIAGYATQAPMNNAIMQYYRRRTPGSGGYIPLSDDG
jgi:hypothetical protein